MNKKLCFLTVGAIAFCIDASVFWFLFDVVSIEMYCSRITAFIFAVLVTWYGNRTFTFQERKQLPIYKQLRRAFVSSLCSLLPNITFFYLLTSVLPQPNFIHIAFIGGVIAGTISNFILSDKFVYKEC
ncbi:GtrA family protein [Psychromonas sp. 14N.309.X.WAT.B.A12]|uniref:GtrA family protein n=1 Tax=unclassified Psychromonas TaxID=2614957 RepID=UPI0025C93FC5|nr:GtrA family protein [Psychromonas sp. 14N.309.X.WAT.B.A12]